MLDSGCDPSIILPFFNLIFCSSYFHILMYLHIYSYAVLATGCASCPKIICARPGCGTAFCYHCKQKWHPNQTCVAARNERANQLFFSALNNLRSNLRASVSYTTYTHETTDNKEHGKYTSKVPQKDSNFLSEKF